MSVKAVAIRVEGIYGETIGEIRLDPTSCNKYELEILPEDGKVLPLSSGVVIRLVVTDEENI